jgi:hypothetical protein
MKGRETAAENNDPAHIFIGAIFLGLGGDVMMKGVEVAFGERREDNLDQTSLGLAPGPDSKDHQSNGPTTSSPTTREITPSNCAGIAGSFLAAY